MESPTPDQPPRETLAEAPSGPLGHARSRARASLHGRRSRWLPLVAVAAGGLLLAGCQLPSFGAHHAITSQGKDALKLWQGFFIAGAAVFVLVFCLITFAVIRYRRRSDAIPRQTQYHTLLEIAYTTIPVIIVLILFAFTFVTENEVDALPKPAMSVTVTGFQWGWRFHYTTQHVTVIGVELQDPVMVLPEHENVRIYLESHDVIHGFYVPAFDFSRYAQPGVINKFTVNLQHTGTYRGQCTQFCGLYHSLMRFRVKVVSPAQFASWASGHRSSGPEASITSTEQRAPTAAAGATSTKISTATGPTTGGYTS